MDIQHLHDVWNIKSEYIYRKKSVYEFSKLQIEEYSNQILNKKKR